MTRQLNTLAHIDIVADAIVQEWSDYEDVRRKHSMALFGHPGAHIANIHMPTPVTLAVAVLAALDASIRRATDTSDEGEKDAD